MEGLAASRDRPECIFRIITFHWIGKTLLIRRLSLFLTEPPGIIVQVGVEDKLQDIVANNCDAALRFGEDVEKDEIELQFAGLSSEEIERVRARIEKAQTGLTAIDERIEDAWNAAEVELSEENMKMLERLLPSYVRQHMQLAA